MLVLPTDLKWHFSSCKSFAFSKTHADCKQKNRYYAEHGFAPGRPVANLIK